MLLCFKESVWIANEFFKKLTLKDSKVSPSEIGSKVFYCIFGGQNWLNEIIPFFLILTGTYMEELFMIPIQNR